MSKRKWVIVAAILESASIYVSEILFAYLRYSVILLPAHPASFAHKFLFQRVPGCNSIADLSLKMVFWTHKFAVGTH